jgi:hypothetical protein
MRPTPNAAMCLHICPIHTGYSVTHIPSPYPITRVLAAVHNPPAECDGEQASCCLLLGRPHAVTSAPCRGNKWTVSHDALQHVESVDMMCCHPPKMMDVAHTCTHPQRATAVSYRSTSLHCAAMRTVAPVCWASTAHTAAPKTLGTW